MTSKTGKYQETLEGISEDLNTLKTYVEERLKEQGNRSDTLQKVVGDVEELKSATASSNLSKSSANNGEVTKVITKLMDQTKKMIVAENKDLFTKMKQEKEEAKREMAALFTEMKETIAAENNARRQEKEEAKQEMTALFTEMKDTIVAENKHKMKKLFSKMSKKVLKED